MRLRGIWDRATAEIRTRRQLREVEAEIDTVSRDAATRDRQGAEIARGSQADHAYSRWTEGEKQEGNPPDSPMRDAVIDWYAVEYPEPGGREVRGDVAQMEQTPDGAWEYPGREEVPPGQLRFVPMRQPDPYDPLYLPNYSYWPLAEREAGS